MEENRDLLRITKEEQGMGVHWDVHGGDEMMGLCVAIATCAKRNNAFLFMLLGIIREAFNNDEFAKELERDCVEMPDFDAVLKGQNNG